MMTEAECPDCGGLGFDWATELDCAACFSSAHLSPAPSSPAPLPGGGRAGSSVTSADVLAKNAETVRGSIFEIVRRPEFALGFADGRAGVWRDQWDWIRVLRAEGHEPCWRRTDGSEHWDVWGYDRGQLLSAACLDLDVDDFDEAQARGFRGAAWVRIYRTAQEAFRRGDVL